MHVEYYILQGKWNIKDDEHKKRIIKRVGKMWKDFKSRMVVKLIEGEDPCEKYDYITKEQWEKFKKAKETPEFKVTYLYNLVFLIFL